MKNCFVSLNQQVYVSSIVTVFDNESDLLYSSMKKCLPAKYQAGQTPQALKGQRKYFIIFLFKPSMHRNILYPKKLLLINIVKNSNNKMID